jgi:hypothetical protein
MPASGLHGGKGNEKERKKVDMSEQLWDNKIMKTTSNPELRGETMKMWRIGNSASGLDLGLYEAETEADAIELLAHVSGYRDAAAMNEATSGVNLVVVEEIHDPDGSRHAELDAKELKPGGGPDIFDAVCN